MQRAIYNDGDNKKYIQTINVHLEKDFEIIFIESDYAILTDKYKIKNKKINRICFLEELSREDFFNKINNYFEKGYEIDCADKDFVKFNNGKWMTILSDESSIENNDKWK